MAFVIVDLACQRSTVSYLSQLIVLISTNSRSALLPGTVCSQAGDTAIAYLHTCPGECSQWPVISDCFSPNHDCSVNEMAKFQSVCKLQS